MHRKKGIVGFQNEESPESLLITQVPESPRREIPVATISLPQPRMKQEGDLATHRVIDDIERLEIEHYLNQGPNPLAPEA